LAALVTVLRLALSVTGDGLSREALGFFVIGLALGFGAGGVEAAGEVLLGEAY
jgi:hypothetical protein